MNSPAAGGTGAGSFLNSPAADWIIAFLVSGLFAWLFYRSLYGLFCAVIIVPFVLRLRRTGREQKRQDQMQTGFCSALETISGALRAGYSMERAWIEAQKELTSLYGTTAPVTEAFRRMNRQVRLNEPLEKCLMQFAAESGIEDLFHFAELFRYAKRNGGNMSDMIHAALRRFRDRESVRAEIRTAITAKRMEQHMMLVLVPGMLFFVTASSGEYTDVLFHTLPGVLIMTGGLVGYVAAAGWAQKIISIEV